MNLTGKGVERLFPGNIFLLSIFEKTKNKQTKTIMGIMILGCPLQRVARAYYSALGHGTARAHLIASAAHLLCVCYTTTLFCAAREARTLWRHF